MLKAPAKTSPPSTAPAAAATFDATAAVISATGVTAEIRHLTINNTGGNNDYGYGVYTNSVVDGSFSMLHVTATATDSTFNYGVSTVSSSPTMNNVTATATDGAAATACQQSSSSPTMTNVTATATDGNFSYGVSTFVVADDD